MQPPSDTAASLCSCCLAVAAGPPGEAADGGDPGDPASAGALTWMAAPQGLWVTGRSS
ncbi:MAG TPA: hypothetical protein VMD59_00515 [Acidimicrobiales bacterium]|nr:hypothetical protein [Acidimicrobiales bacterium]